MPVYEVTKKQYSEYPVQGAKIRNSITAYRGLSFIRMIWCLMWLHLRGVPSVKMRWGE